MLDKNYDIYYSSNYEKELTYAVVGKLSNRLLHYKNIEGEKLYQTSRLFNLIAKRKFDTKLELSANGNKLFNLELAKTICSKKLFKSNYNIELLGKKRINFSQEKLIKGKKDLMPILMAVGLLEE
ncbi:unnamed protein product [marine sediment metagenome]|uniref:Uncharacterized protein n=1 Tax=marine sediment metagenome TaxID=412755 RepID=X1AAL5_9ZZZZ